MEDAQKVCNDNHVIIKCRHIAVPGRLLQWQPRISGHNFPGIRVYSASSWHLTKEPLEFVLGSIPPLIPAICGLNLLVLYSAMKGFFLGYFRFPIVWLLQVALALNISSELLMHLMASFAVWQPKQGVLARRHFPQEQAQSNALLFWCNLIDLSSPHLWKHVFPIVEPSDRLRTNEGEETWLQMRTFYDLVRLARITFCFRKLLGQPSWTAVWGHKEQPNHCLFWSEHESRSVASASS